MGKTAVLLIWLFGMFVPSYQYCQKTLIYSMLKLLKLMSTQFSSYQATANDLFDRYRFNVSYPYDHKYSDK